MGWLLASLQIGALDWLATIASQSESKLHSKEAVEYLSNEQVRIRKLLTNLEKRIEAERENKKLPPLFSLFEDTQKGAA